MKSFFDATVIPSVAYTDPEVAWVGMTETEAKAKGIKYGKGAFPWAASGRSLALGRDEGMTKLLFDEGTHRVLGCGIVGPNAGELIAEAGLAIEMGADASDIGLTIHPHPTLSETIGMAAEMYEGTITDLIAPKKRPGPGARPWALIFKEWRSPSERMLPCSRAPTFHGMGPGNHEDHPDPRRVL